MHTVKTHATRWRPSDSQFAREYKSRLMSKGLLVRHHRKSAGKQDAPSSMAVGTGTFVVHTDVALRSTEGMFDLGKQ